MKIMELGVGCMVDSNSLDRGDRMGFCDYMTLKRTFPNIQYYKVTLRNLIYSLIGSSKLSHKQALSIDKIYEEYRDKLDYTLYDKYILEHKNALLIGVDIDSSLKLIGILEYMFSLLPEFEDNLDDMYKYMLMDVNIFDVVTFKYSIFARCYEVALGDNKNLLEFSKLQNKLKITVFKKEVRVTKPDEMYLNALRQIIFGQDIELFKYTIFGLLGYNGVIDNGAYGSDYQLFYRKDGKNNKLADELIKKYKPIKLEDRRLPYSDMLREAITVVFNSLETDKEIIENTIQTFYSTIGGYIPVSQKGLERIFKCFQQMNNLASVYNLSIEFLNWVENKKNILRNCLLSTSCFLDDEEDIIVEAYSMYFKYTILDYLHKNHLGDIETSLKALKDTYTNAKELSELRNEVELLKYQIAKLNNDNKYLNAQLENKDDKKIHKEYYDLIKGVTTANEKLESELAKEKLKNRELSSKLNNNSSDDNDDDLTNNLDSVVKEVNLQDYKILIIGHQEAYSNAQQLSKVFKSVNFIDGMNSNIDFSKNQMDNVDFVLLQYEFVLHKCTKYLDLAKRCNKPILRLKGTNKDYWLKQMKDEISSLIQQV